MCRNKKWEESNKSAKTKKVMLRQGFLVGCQHQEEIFATKKFLSRQMKQAESINFVMTEFLCYFLECSSRYTKDKGLNIGI